MAEEPTLGEVVRRLDAMSQRQDATSRRVEELLDRTDVRYVPRGEWVEGRRADQTRIREVENDIGELKSKSESDASFRRTTLVMFSVAAFSASLSALVALAFFVLGK